MNRVEAYLQIPVEYAGGAKASPRWSASGDAIEHPDGTTLCFAAEVALFLEGYASVGPLIHFAHIVNLMLLLDERSIEKRIGAPRGINLDTGELFSEREIRDYLAPFADWCRMYREAGRIPRNAGALCARICRLVPITVDPPDPREISLRLGDGSLRSAMAVHRVATAPLADEIETPAMPGVVFELHFLQALGEFSSEEVAHWFRHGQGPPGDAGDAIAREMVVHKRPAEDGLLASLEARERLAGAAPMVAQLVGALALPPRRRADRGLPTGGYSDVTNRGAIDQILPSQLAVDPDEFVRRFAENELLFFHREEPHAPIGEELVILLDQGVRCWGRVRLLLAAAAIALGRNAGRKAMPWRIAGTSNEGRLLDPARDDPDTLGSFWEASDLSADPALALEGLLERVASEGGETPRDVVVLSHTRSVLVPGFAAAARRAGPGTRLFTVAADERGWVELGEWRRGAMVPIAAFRVEPTPSQAPPRRSRADATAWGGDVEPVGYPFRLGLSDAIDAPHFDFDHAGKRLALATRGGTIHAFALDGSSAEVLPRGLVGGELLTRVVALIGVADGFVVAGLMGGRATLAAVHYDFATRVVRTYPLDSSDLDRQWFYFRGLHAVVARGAADVSVIDLATGATIRSKQASFDSLALEIRALRLANAYAFPPPRLAIVDEGHPDPGRGGTVALDPRSGAVQLDRVEPPWSEFTPMTDGRPALEGGRIDQAQLRGHVLALRVARAKGDARLMLFQGPAGIPIREVSPHARSDMFLLSADGRLIANRLNERQIMVQVTSGPTRPVFVTPKGMSHNGLELTLGPHAMAVRAGRRATLVAWGTGRLESWTVPDDAPGMARDRDPGPLTVPASKATPIPSTLAPHGDRFVSCARSGLIAVVDHFGQVALFDPDERLVAMVLVFRGAVAAWMPDGTRLGPPAMIDEADADADRAARAIGQALREASRKAGR